MIVCVMRLCAPVTLLVVSASAQSAELYLNEIGYFEAPGLNVIVFDDIYPEGHQTGVTIIQNGVRVAASGDLRLEASPGQWSPVPLAGERQVDEKASRISQRLSYPDPARDRQGFNPIEYPDVELTYTVSVTSAGDNAVRIVVDLDEPLPDEWIGRVGFNFELFPGDLFGRSFLMDDEAGIFPTQPNGPLVQRAGEQLAEPLASGRRLVVAPESVQQRMVIENLNGELELLDGRSNHNNGWYIVRSNVPAGASKAAIEWVVQASADPDWRHGPVIQVSQLGYTVSQPKRVVIETDRRDTGSRRLSIWRLTADGRELVREIEPDRWSGDFLRYRYLVHDFTDIETPGLYVAGYDGKESQAFRIGNDVFARHAWQPTLEYYLPVQMCHMRVNEKYRVWHGNDHADDARMAPVNHNHFDGYVQGPTTLTEYESLEPVHGLNAGGWHDAGDYDLRVESQAGTVWRLAQMIEEFSLDYDATLIDQERQLVEIHVADGISDAHQQVEHGLLTVLGGYRALGRLYRGIIVPTIRQYVLLGDGSTQTDNRVYDAASATTEEMDDRWVFTEQNPSRELQVVASLAAASRVMREHNPAISREALQAARALFDAAVDQTDDTPARVFAMSELLQTTGERKYRDRLLALQDEIVATIEDSGWTLAKAMPFMDNPAFEKAVGDAVAAYQATVAVQAGETPYGVPYRPHIWGAAWGIQAFAVRQYFFGKAWPKVTDPDVWMNALSFVLGVHPGANTTSFVSGVGASSALVAYGVNRADWSFIPGGVISGTALIRPDYPELKTWPFFWQQTEYVMGGGGTNYMFLALAADRSTH